MPKYTELNDDDKLLLKQQGMDPEGQDWVIDRETDEVFDRASLPSLGVLGQIGETVRGLVPGAMETVLSPVKAAGSVADLIRRGQGTYDPAEPSDLTMAANQLQEDTEANAGEPDVRAHWLAKGLGRGIGQLGTLAGGGMLGALSRGPKALDAISGIVGGVGGLMNAQSTLDRELEQQDKAGVNKPGLAAGKAAAAGVLGAATDALFGPGRLIRNAGRPGTLGEIAKRAGVNALSGGLTEGAQQLTEDLLVTGKPDIGNELRAAAVGGLVQPTGGLAIDLPLRAEEVSKVNDKVTAAKKTGPYSLDQPATVDVPIENPEMPAIMAAIRAGKGWNPPGESTAVDAAIDDISKKNIPVTEKDIAELFTLQGNEPALQKRIRDLYVRSVEQQAAQPKPLVDQVAGELKVRAKYDTVRSNLEKRITDSGKQLNDMAKELEKNPGLGNQALFQEKQKLHEQQAAVHREQLTELNRQENVELEQLRQASTIEGITERPQELGLPIPADKSGVRVGPGQGPTYTGPAIVPPIVQGDVIDVPSYGGELNVPPNMQREAIAGRPLPAAIPEQTGGPILQGPPSGKQPLQLTERAGESSADYIKNIGFEAIARAKAEGKKFSPEIEKAYQDYRAQQEGEQGLPFGDNVRHSTIVPPETMKMLDEAIKEIMPHLQGTSAIEPFYLIGQGTTSRMATQNPTGGLVKYLFDVYLQTDRDSGWSQLHDMLRPAEKFGKSDNGKAWIRNANKTRSWDMSGLTDEEKIGATAIKDFVEFTRNYANQQGVYVHEIKKDGSMEWRPGKLIPGWTPTTPGDHVHRAAMAGGAEIEKLKEDFYQNWAKHFGPNTRDMADAAMGKMVPILDRNRQSGEPLFSPVILPKGVDLPDSWKSDSPWNDLTRYARRYAQHMSWAKNVQNNPAGRAAFGLKTDAMGRVDKKPIKWTDVPDAWAGAVREGRRAYAKWAKNADPNSPPDTVIQPFYNDKLMEAMMLSYRQGSSDEPMGQALNQLASRGLIGTIGGVRDATMAVNTASQYGDVGTTVKNVLNYVTDRKGAQERTRIAGAMGPDNFAAESVDEANRIAKGIMKLASAAGKVTGREQLDIFGKSLIYEVMNSLQEDKKAKLMAEFGPIENMAPEKAAEMTAARLSRRASNTSTAENLPPYLLPQSTDWRSKWFGLSRWGVGQWNNFVEDTVRPFLHGNSKEALSRFLKLTVGTVISSSILNSIVNALFDRKPDQLTWGELFNVVNDPNIPSEKKIQEFAYTTLANMQLAGAYGWVGDLALAGVRAGVGGNSMSHPLDAQYPLLIMGINWGKTLVSFLGAVANKRAGAADLGQLIQEGVGATQNGRILNRMMEASGLDEKEIKRPIRDAEVVERVFDVNTKTGRPEGPTAGIRAEAASDPFSATKQALRIPESEYGGRLGEFLKSYRKSSGEPFQLNRWSQGRDYYGQLARIAGKEEAKKAEEEAAVLNEIIRKKNRALRDASR